MHYDEIKSLAHCSAEEMRHKVNANATYAIDQIRKISDSTVAEYCQGIYRQSETYMMLSTMTTNLLAVRGITKEPKMDQILASIQSLDSIAIMDKTFTGLQVLTTQIALHYMCHGDDALAERVMNILTELVNRNTHILLEAVSEGIETIAIKETAKRKAG